MSDIRPKVTKNDVTQVLKESIGSNPAEIFRLEKGQIAAVLDWQDARFGDPLMDLAYLDFWPSGFDHVELYERYCLERGATHTNYRKRIAACKMYNGIDAMRFFAKVDNRKAYESVLKILELVEA